MNTQDSLRKYISEKGVKQNWIIEKIKEINPNARFSNHKLSRSLSGNRILSADEFLLICKALEVSPDIFISTQKTA